MPFNVAGGNISKIAYENANEAIKKSDEAKATAEEAKELSESVLSGEVDLGVTRTKIDEKLSVLEEQYAPKLTEVSSQLAQKATKEELNTEKGRINNLVAHAGNTDGNAELLDIRVGWDGVVYPTAGDAVRSIQKFMTAENEIWEV